MIATWIVFFALVTALPVKFAADFTGGGNTGLIACGIASLVAPALGVLAFRLSLGGFMGVVAAYVAMVATYVLVLRIPGRSVIGFGIVVLAMQIAAIGAVLSYGGGRLSMGASL